MKKEKIKTNFLFNFKRFIGISLLALTFFTTKTVNAQDGAALFDDLCADCHSVGDGIYYGPDLMGVEGKFSAEWLLKFVKSSKSMIAAGDSKAVAIFEEFKKKKMPNTDASDEEIKAIFAYIKSLNKNPVKATPEKVVATNTDKTNPTTNSPSSNNVASVSGGGVSDERIATLEKKLDELLEMQARQEEKEALPENIANGKLLFTGKKEFVNGAPNCVSCHNLNVIDTINWNPSAYALATTYTRARGFNMAKMLRSPSSSKMKDLLENHELTEYEVFDIKAFLHQISKTGLIPQKSKSKISWYVILTIICFLALIDLLFIGTVNKKITALVFFVGIAFVAKALYYEGSHIGITQYYQPEQPIKFSHKIHAGENKIQCMYCHYSPEYSKIASIPSADICINCHNKIKSGKNSGTFEINKIYETLKTGKPIKWVKVHNLPDHVFYSHAQHVGAGKLQCKTCHGKIEEMDQVKQVSPLTMGWCLDCHRSHKVNFKNKYYDNYKTLHQDLKSGKKAFITVKDIGGEDCQKCHY